MLSSQGDGIKQEDFASFDLKIHNAIALNQKMGAFTGYTPGGYKIDETMLENDGLVKLISAKYPFNQPFVEFNLENIKKMEFGMLCLFLMVTTCDFRVVY